VESAAHRFASPRAQLTAQAPDRHKRVKHRFDQRAAIERFDAAKPISPVANDLFDPIKRASPSTPVRRTHRFDTVRRKRFSPRVTNQQNPTRADSRRVLGVAQEENSSGNPDDLAALRRLR